MNGDLAATDWVQSDGTRAIRVWSFGPGRLEPVMDLGGTPLRLVRLDSDAYAVEVAIWTASLDHVVVRCTVVGRTCARTPSHAFMARPT